MKKLFAAAFLFWGTIAAAEEPDFLGPLRIRDLSPITMLRLDFVPAHALRGRWRAVRVNYSQANVYIVTDAVADYLRIRGNDEPLGQADIEEIFRTDGDVFFFDGELTVVETEYIQSLTERTQLQVTWPLVMHGGGFLDRTIENFHEAIGHNTASRDLTSRNDLQVIARLGGDELRMIDHGTRGATGDPSVSLRQVVPLRPSMDLVAEIAVKIPIGNRQEYFSSGSADLGAQLSLQRKFARTAFYLSTSYVKVGDIRIFRNFPLTDAQTIGLSLERRLGRRHWFLTQATWSRGAFRRATALEVTADRTQISLGLRRAVSDRMAITAAITENVIQFKNTPDIGIHFGIGLMLDRPSRNHP